MKTGKKYKTSPYKRGYAFEVRTKKYLEKLNYLVYRQGKSSFPDLIVIDKDTHKVIFVECKIGKYLSKDEKLKADKLVSEGFIFKIAFRDGRKLKFREYIGGGIIRE